MTQDPTPALNESRLAALKAIPINEAPSPSYVIHEERLIDNAQILQDFASRSGAKVLLALKGFACHHYFRKIGPYLSGTTSSGLHEALLAKDSFGKEIHVYCPAYKDSELETLNEFAHSLIFNSPSQLQRALERLPEQGPTLGLRVNPECSTGDTPLYDASARGSRLGTTRAVFDAACKSSDRDLIATLEGLHFHTLCEQDADALEITVHAFEEKFGDLLPKMKWVNFGGGHHFTRPNYDLERAIQVVKNFKSRHDLEVYLEPGEAVALHSGILISTILDLHQSGDTQIAILDTSATCHMPDVLEMPYRPNILGANDGVDHPYRYRIGGLSCLAGDVIGDYGFPEPLRIGQRLVFLDMAHYTMVKTSTFNGVPLPAICNYNAIDGLQIIREFDYSDFRNRLS
ncbi:MAG: Carboxynorspermidine/carboxyspermidine decarboxylase [Opitutia bacterium UBA7350]|nr:MAG: Carboxynorspermidine/carboxyspermidine decarboxylase [Opitutae bacterium UBA7350]